MIFKVKWGEMEKILKQRFSTEQTPKSPIFYFEDNQIHIYQANKNYILYSTVPMNAFTDMNAFKMEYLSDSIELLEKPKENNIVIKQE